MTRSRRRATYPLEEVQALSANGSFTINGRSRQWIINHLNRFDVSSIIQRVIASIQPTDFQESDELEMIPGKWADIYRYVMTGDDELDGEDGWYVKVLIDESDRLRLSVLSANWDGYIH